MKKNIFIAGIALTSLVSCVHRDPAESSKTDSTAQAPVDSSAPTKAQAVLKVADGYKMKGMVHFTEENGSMKIETHIDGLKPGPHGFHIHEKGDCSAKDFSSAGGHFNPAHAEHGAIDSNKRHVGDMGNLVADKNGKAYSTILVKGMTMRSGADSILGRALVIHKDQDDLKSQPAGNSGARIGCGAIEAL